MTCRLFWKWRNWRNESQQELEGPRVEGRKAFTMSEATAAEYMSVQDSRRTSMPRTKSEMVGEVEIGREPSPDPETAGWG